MRPGDKQRLEGAIATYLEDCYARSSPPRIDELAQTLRLHPVVVRRRAVRVLGITVARYMKAAQLHFACELLKAGLVVEEVARRAAFGSRRAFLRAFQRELQQTPAAYRMQYENVTRQPLAVEPRFSSIQSQQPVTNPASAEANDDGESTRQLALHGNLSLR